MAGMQNVLNCLKTEFEEAQHGLKSVDDNIKKITGREAGIGRGKGIRRSASSKDCDGDEIEEGEIVNDEPSTKKKFLGSVFGRSHYTAVGRSVPRETPRGRPVGFRMKVDDDDDKLIRKPTLSSTVIATQREVKPRQEAMDEQKCDKKSMARNKRMFGMMLGTLQRFRSEETQRKEITTKRIEIEKKLEQAAEEEKANVKKRRRDLFKSRRDKQAELRRIEFKMERVQIHQEWEKSQQFLSSYIQTKTKPCIFYMPKKHTPVSEKRLKNTRDKYKVVVAERRAKIQKELADIDELYKKENQDLHEPGDEITEVKENNEPNATTEIELGKNIQCSVKSDKGNMTSTDVNLADEAVKIEPTHGGTGDSVHQNMAQDTPGNNEKPDSPGDKEFEPIYDE